MHSPKILVTLLAILWAGMALGQSSPVKKFMRETKRADRKNVTKIGVGKLPITIAKWFVDDELKPLFKHIKKVRLLNTESAEAIDGDRFDQLLTDLDRIGYDQMIYVRESNTKVALRMLGDENRIRYLTALVYEGDQQTIIEIKTKVSLDQLSEIINRFSTLNKPNEKVDNPPRV
ncbi:MAG: DUF4252 domain-containing protein [Saprospiraceae bacterium]|nr:DUF4252 domain-containing protein [Saprospiraceae bacterium]